MGTELVVQPAVLPFRERPSTAHSAPAYGDFKTADVVLKAPDAALISIKNPQVKYLWVPSRLGHFR